MWRRVAYVVVLIVLCAMFARAQSPYVTPAQKAILDMYYLSRLVQIGTTNIADRAITLAKLDWPLPAGTVTEADPLWAASPSYTITALQISTWDAFVGASPAAVSNAQIVASQAMAVAEAAFTNSQLAIGIASTVSVSFTSARMVRLAITELGNRHVGHFSPAGGLLNMPLSTWKSGHTNTLGDFKP